MGLPRPQPELTCLVTGASSGIGADIARSLARKGYGVTVTARRRPALDALAAELSATGVRVEVIAADLTDPADREKLLGDVSERGLEVAVLANNAGFSTSGPVASADPDAELRQVAVDVAAVVDLTTRVLPGMVERGEGGVLFTASTAAFQPVPGQAAYGASKAFVLSYAQAVSAEVSGHGVAVTALCPGPVDTGFADAAGFTGDETEALPRVMWKSSATVAEAGVDGLFDGRLVVVPGLANRVVTTLSWHTPRRLILPILAKQHPALRRPR